MSSDFYEVTTATDFRGGRIELGSTVLYPRQMGDTLEMQEGFVVAIMVKDITKSVRPEGWVYDGNNAGDWIKVPDKETKFKIQPTRSSRYNRNMYERHWSTGEMEKVKPVWVLKGMNVVKVD